MSLIPFVTTGGRHESGKVRSAHHQWLDGGSCPSYQTERTIPSPVSQKSLQGTLRNYPCPNPGQPPSGGSRRETLSVRYVVLTFVGGWVLVMAALFIFGSYGFWLSLHSVIVRGQT